MTDSMFTPNAHHLSYGATDQQTLRDLGSSYNGLLVPGTIAAWQRKGTGGFVLTLSAVGNDSKPYAIDPRFPLFQQALPNPKQSHIALAEAIFEDAALIGATSPTPASFSDERVQELAQRWVRFNTKYMSSSADDFSKYAKRLKKAVKPQDAQPPERVLAPYFMASGTGDPWWELSKKLFHETCEEASEVIRATRVVAATTASALNPLLEQVKDEQCAIWVSGLNENSVEAVELATYRAAIQAAKARGTSVFALYGGFFGVLLGADGLMGSAHGVGFSEHRAWQELPTSGAAPPRFYLAKVHRFVSPDIAQVLYQLDPDLVACGCAECQGRAPVSLDYHELMKHSVRCRAAEIDAWGGLDGSDAADDLMEEHDDYVERVRALNLPTPIRRRALAAAEHLPKFAAALS